MSKKDGNRLRGIAAYKHGAVARAGVTGRLTGRYQLKSEHGARLHNPKPIIGRKMILHGEGMQPGVAQKQTLRIALTCALF